MKVCNLNLQNTCLQNNK